MGTNPLIFNATLGTINPPTTGYDFFTQTDRNSITLAKIRNFSFNAGTGGTLTLGGANNGNGLMLVKDSTGVTRIQMDNTGISITNGNITIANTAGGTILDSSGIVSTVNFPSAYLFSNTPGSTTSTSYVAMSGASLSPFVLTRSAKVFVFCSVWGFLKHWYNSGNTMTVQGSSSIDGQLFSMPYTEVTAVNSIDFAGSTWSTRFTDMFSSIGIIQTLSAGTQTINLNFKADSAGTAFFDDYAFGYIVLGN